MKPLTIEELKALPIGDWVWIVVLKSDCINKAHNGKYYHIQHCGSFGDKELWCGWQGYGTAFEYSDYGTKWIAYKNKEQAEAKGEIVELPCKVGDTVWYIEYGYCYPNLKSRLEAKPIVVTEISWKHNRSGKDLGFALIANGTRYNFSSISKTVFFTKAQAEVRLQELRGEK